MLGKRPQITIALVLFCAAILGCKEVETEGQVVVNSRPVLMEGLHRPGFGPRSRDEVFLLSSYPERLWLTSVSLTTQGEDGSLVDPGNLTSLDFGLYSPERYRQLHSLSTVPHPSFFHLTGETRELAFPAGFALPVFSNEQLFLETQWQNLDLYGQPNKFQVSMKVQFLRDRALASGEEVQPLSAYVLDCSVDNQSSAPIKAYLSETHFDQSEKDQASRWIMPGGFHMVETEIQTLPPEPKMTVRLAVAYLYHGWRSFELFDQTTGEAVLRFKAGDGTKLVRDFPEGLTVFPRHDLKLRVEYENDSPSLLMGMGRLVLYVDSPP